MKRIILNKHKILNNKIILFRRALEIILLKIDSKSKRESETSGLTLVCAFMLSCVQLFETPWTVACQASLCGQEYWSRLPFPTPGDLPDPGIKSASLALTGAFFTTSASWENDIDACFINWGRSSLYM